MKIYAELKEVKAWRHFCPKCDKQLNTIFPPVVCDCCGKWKFDINKNNYVMEVKDEL